MGIVTAYIGADIQDGDTVYKDHALVAGSDGVFTLHPRAALPQGCPTVALRGGVIAPSFVDLQVNGGGGVMFNDTQTIDALRTIAQAHASTGTGAILPTLITDTPQKTKAAIAAVQQAIHEGVDGIAGLHLEGPHLSVARKGAHDAALIRTMEDDDLAVLLDAADHIANLMVTIAPETTTLAQIKTMSDAGIVVSLGHTDAGQKTCHAAFDAGARCVTHLFNAMSPLASREPGLVGATLSRPDIFAGLISDAIHVHPETIKIALAAKPQSDRIFLVTDAMATVGSDIDQFTLNGRDVFRADNRLTLSDGTLAGADLNMPRAIDVMIHEVQDTRTRAIARATSTPASLLRDRKALGRVSSGAAVVVYFGDAGAKPVTLRATDRGPFKGG